MQEDDKELISFIENEVNKYRFYKKEIRKKYFKNYTISCIKKSIKVK